MTRTEHDAAALSYLADRAAGRWRGGCGPHLQNGARVLLGRVGGVVLAYWEGRLHPYVTWSTDRDGSAYWGHYHANLAEAVADFAERA